jgi:hypothetical protein
MSSKNINTITRRVKKYKTYLFDCQENREVYRLLAARDWSQGDLVVLPPIRVRGEKALLFGNEYYIHLAKVPTIYGDSGYLGKGGYLIYPKGNRRWKLKHL